MTDNIEDVLAKLSPQGAALCRAVLAQPDLRAKTIGGPIDVSTPDYELAIMKENLLSAQVCTRLRGKEAEALMCDQHSAGTSGGWELALDVAPVACDSHPDTHTHYVLHC